MMNHRLRQGFGCVSLSEISAAPGPGGRDGDAFDLRRKPVTAPGNRDDEFVLGRCLLRQSFSQQENALGQVAFLDDRVAPDRLHQLLFRQQPLRVAGHVEEQVKSSRGYCDGHAAKREDAIRGVQLKPLEPVQSVGFKTHMAP
jgi:hypothetical protein